MIADFHIHSKYSYDSILSPRTILKVAKKQGLNAIAITDHDTIKGGVETQKINTDKDFLVIVGSEVNTEIGDLIGLNLNEEIKSKNSIEVIEEIKAQGGYVILPHPYRGHKLNEHIIENSDAIEVFNGRSTREQNMKALELAKKYFKPFIAVNVGLLFPSYVGVKIPKCVGIKFPNCVGIKIPNVLPESIWDVHARGRGVFYVTGSSA